jgi:hypothetical protein
VILIASWKQYKAGESPEFNSALTKTLAELRQSSARIWIMQDVPHFSRDVPSALARAALSRKNPEKLNLPLNSYREQIVDQEHEFLQTAASDVIILNPARYLSKGSILPFSESGFAIYRDNAHLTIHGAMLIPPMFRPIFAP